MVVDPTDEEQMNIGYDVWHMQGRVRQGRKARETEKESKRDKERKRVASLHHRGWRVTQVAGVYMLTKGWAETRLRSP